MFENYDYRMEEMCRFKRDKTFRREKARKPYRQRCVKKDRQTDK